MYMADVRVGERMGVVIGFMTRRAKALVDTFLFMVGH